MIVVDILPPGLRRHLVRMSLLRGLGHRDARITGILVAQPAAQEIWLFVENPHGVSHVQWTFVEVADGPA